MSCRALGRKIEDIIAFKMLELATKYFNASKNINIAYKKGERNIPAMKWPSNFSNLNLLDKRYCKIYFARRI